MSIEETRVLLRHYRIVPNKVLGQNFMVDSSIYSKLSRYAALTLHDTVLDAGAGFGFLARFLANKCKAVVAVEKDASVAQALRDQVKKFSNITVIEGDMLKAEVPDFNKVISFPPYYVSSHLVTWLLDHGFECAVLIVQKEFANRLVAPVCSKEYGWLSVVAFQAVEVDLLDEVPKWMFLPEPEVDSIVMRLKPWTILPFTVKDKFLFRRIAKWLFTHRNKKLGNALVPFLRCELEMGKLEAEKFSSTFSMRDKRVRELAPNVFGELTDALCQ
jgi:16S rRNA (adenine1518-N6/adenine1519-N6)-dimethyltransferase